MGRKRAYHQKSRVAAHCPGCMGPGMKSYFAPRVTLWPHWDVFDEANSADNRPLWGTVAQCTNCAAIKVTKRTGKALRKALREGKAFELERPQPVIAINLSNRTAAE